MKWIIVARVATVCVCSNTHTLSLKHFGTWNREKRNSIQKGPAFRNGFTSKILVWCALLCLMFKVFFIKWPELMLMYFFVFFLKTKERKEERVSSRESTQLTRVIRHVIERDAKIYLFDMKEESCYTLRVVKKNMTKNLPERMQKISPPTKKGNTSREMEESYPILWPTSFEWSTVQTKTRISIQVCFFLRAT